MDARGLHGKMLLVRYWMHYKQIKRAFQCWKALLQYLEEFDFFIGVLYIEISEVSF